MTRFAVACVFACTPILSARADDPKPDVTKLKDDVELLEAKLGVWKAKVAGAEKSAEVSKLFLDRLQEAERKGVAAHSDMVGVMQSHTQASTDLAVNKAELKVAEVMLAQAKRRLTAAEKMAGGKPEKTYTIHLENKSWGDVFAWFAKETGLANNVKEKPTGTVTLKPRDGREYTMTEVVDLLNELMAPKFALVRGEKSFTVLPADERPDTDFFAKVELADLAKYGRTELVEVKIPFPSGLKADDAIPQLKVMLSSFGNLKSDGKKNLTVWDKAGNVRRIKAEFDQLREGK